MYLKLRISKNGDTRIDFFEENDFFNIPPETKKAVLKDISDKKKNKATDQSVNTECAVENKRYFFRV